MALLVRPFEDILIDRVKTALETFRNEQIALDVSVDFDVFRDRSRPYHGMKKPVVNIWSDGNTPGPSSSKAYAMEEFQIIFDCITRGNDGYLPALLDAANRLYYLKEQVRYAVFRLVNTDFGFAPGVISSKSKPTWTRFKGDDNMPEETVIGGRWTFSLSCAWNGEDVAGVPLDELSWSIKLSKLGQTAGAGAAHVDGLEEYGT